LLTVNLNFFHQLLACLESEEYSVQISVPMSEKQGWNSRKCDFPTELTLLTVNLNF